MCPKAPAALPTDQPGFSLGTAGATYPVHKVDVEHFNSEHEGAGVTASMTGEEPAPKTHQRAMLSIESSVLTAGVLGRKPRALPA